MPDAKFDIGAFAYAHRGLWGGAVPENSIAAFEAAARAGVGCELDVRRTADDQLVVFHDATLQRLCNRPERVDALTLNELGATRLPDGSNIPTLADALAAMAGLPTLVEVKIDGEDRRIVAPVIATLRDSDAQFSVMSFDEPTVAQLRAGLPETPVGQLLAPDDKAAAIAVAERAEALGCNYLGPHISVLNAVSRRFEHLPRTVWTIRNLGDLAAVRAEYAAPIFEGFSPELAKGFANLPNG